MLLDHKRCLSRPEFPFCVSSKEKREYFSACLPFIFKQRETDSNTVNWALFLASAVPAPEGGVREERNGSGSTGVFVMRMLLVSKLFMLFIEFKSHVLP